VIKKLVLLGAGIALVGAVALASAPTTPTAQSEDEPWACQVYLDGWWQAYNAWEATYCDSLDWPTYDYMNAKYGIGHWWMPSEQIAWAPDVRITHFVGLGRDGGYAYYEGPWVQLRSAGGCVQLHNPYWAGP